MNEDEVIYNGVPDNTYQSRNGKGNKKRKFNDFEIESYSDEDIVTAIKQHYPADLDNSITRFFLVKKYLITDKEVLYATHNFTRGYTATEKAEYKNARIKAHEYLLKSAVAHAHPNPDEKAILRWERLAEQYQKTCDFIDNARKQKRLTRLSDRATVAVSFCDAYSFSDEQLQQLKELGIERKHQGIRDKVEALGYTVKEYNNHFKVKRFDTSSRTWKTDHIEYTGLYFLINRNALISSILQGELCQKGKTWQDGLQKTIKRGRPYPDFTFIDSNGDIHSYETMKQAATEHFEVSAKTLQRSLKAKCGKDFIISGETYSLLT